MLRRLAIAIALATCVGAMGCGRKPLPTDLPPAKDQAELQTRFEAMWIGMGEKDVAMYLGKEGAQIAGFSTKAIKRKPKGKMPPPGSADAELSWASEDASSAIRIVFGMDGRAKQIQLLELTPMDPPPGR